ncbi:MAG: hypothetical protein AB7V46_11910 [Thermomicrobiales bacterium]
MAWFEQRGEGKKFHVVFRVAEQRFKKSLGTCGPDEAETIRHRVERRLTSIDLMGLKTWLVQARRG